MLKDIVKSLAKEMRFPVTD